VTLAAGFSGDQGQGDVGLPQRRRVLGVRELGVSPLGVPNAPTVASFGRGRGRVALGCPITRPMSEPQGALPPNGSLPLVRTHPTRSITSRARSRTSRPSVITTSSPLRRRSRNW
jgi:hypothetical protein